MDVDRRGTAGGGGPGLPGRGHRHRRGGREPARPRAVPAGRRRPVPAPGPAAAGDAIRADPAGRREDPRRDRRGGRRQGERRDHDGLRRGHPADVHRQSGVPLDAGVGRRPAPRRPQARQRDRGLRRSRRTLRKALPAKVGAWFRAELLRLGVPPDLAESRVQRHRLRVRAGRPDLDHDEPRLPGADRGGRQRAQPGRFGAFMDKVQAEMAKVATLRDVQVQQTLHYPTVQVVGRPAAGGLERGDRPRRGRLADRRDLFKPVHVAQLLAGRQRRGTSYQVQVQVPPMQMDEANDVGQIPLTTASSRQGARPEPMDSPSNPRRRSSSATWPGSCAARCPARSTGTTCGAT